MAATDNPRRRAIFDYIIAHMTETAGRPPTFREIQRACDIPSTSTVKYHLNVLAADGLIEYTAEMARGISVPGALWVYPVEDDQDAVYWSVVDSEDYVDDWQRSFYPAADLPERMRP